MALFVGLLFALHFSMVKIENQWLEMLVNGGISLAFSLPVSAIVVLINKDFRNYAANFFKKFKHRWMK